MGDRVLVLGGGFVGGMVARVAARRPGTESVAIVTRSRPQPTTDTVEVYVGDGRAPDLGLPPATADALRSSTHFIMAVGRVDLGMTRSQAELEHVAPVRGALAFAETCPSLRRVVLVSSVLAVGGSDWPLPSSMLPPRGCHRNFYEWAKQESERLVRSARLPATVVRPGHVLNSVDDTARTPVPTGIFEALPLLLGGWPVPTAHQRPYWCAPVDIVAELILAAGCGEQPVDSAWCAHPNSPSLARVVAAISARHGAPVKLLQAPRLARLVAKTLRPEWLGASFPRETLAYIVDSPALDLRCLSAVLERADVGFPDDLSFVSRTIDHELNRLAALR